MGICVTCRAQRRVVVRISSWGVPHDSAGHQINYRWTTLSACPRCDVGILVRFDHDCFHPPWEEPWDMSWQWSVPADSVRRLTTALTRCPDPAQPSCDCPAHRCLREGDQSDLTRDVPVTVVLTDDGWPRLQTARAG